MQETLIEFINNFGYWGIALLICVENIFPPIPSEVVLVFGGFLTTHTQMNVWLVILFATVGAVVGAGALYLLGRILKKERIKKLFAGKFGRIMHLKPEDVDKADQWFVKYEYKAVLICRCVPIVRSLISIPAGMSGMKLTPFFLLTILGTAVWNTILVWIGVLAGEAWESTLQYIGIYSKIALAVLAVAVIIAVFVIYKKKRNKKKDGGDLGN